MPTYRSTIEKKDGEFFLVFPPEVLDALGAKAGDQMMWRKEKNGECAVCGTLIMLIENSERSTCRTDGSRYVYTLLLDTGWCIFRCEGCEEPIDENFDPNEWQHLQRPKLALV